MKTHHVVVLSMLAGVGLGAFGVQALHAQAKPPVYLVENNMMTNPDGYMKEYLPLARPVLQAHGGRAIAAGAGIPVEGEPPKNRVAILRFDSLEKLMAWHNSPEYRKAREVGDRYATFNSIAVAGVPQQP